MLKLMIVDDEAVIRSGMATIVDWDSLGIELVAEASNGRDALSQALLLEPDIVITDIKMPLVSGVDFARMLLEKRPKTRIIFLTGYSDFEYMRKAVRLGVDDYLLKPIKVSELEVLIKRISADIISEQEKMQQESSVTKLLARNRPILRGNCFQLFMTGKCQVSFFKAEAVQLGIPLRACHYAAVAFDIDDYNRVSAQEERDYQMRYAVLNIAEETLEQIGASAFGYLPLESSLLGIVNLEYGSLEDVAEACRQIQFYIQRFFDFTVTASIGMEVERLEDFPASCQLACNALKRKIYEGKNRVLLSDGEPPELVQKTILLKKQDENELREAFHMRNNLKLQRKLDEIITTYLSQEQYSALSIRHFGFTLLMIALHTLEDEQISQEEAYGQNSRLSEELAYYETVDEIRMFIKNVYFRTLQALQRQDTGGRNKIVREAMRYVKQNYASGIQVTDVAAAVYVTPNYFSKIFKQEMGENFTEWLNKFRVEKAKELIHSQPYEKIYEIAEQAGFGDYKYFSFIFKKYTGYTPLTYKKLNL